MEDVFYMTKAKFSPEDLYEMLKRSFPDYREISLSLDLPGYMRHVAVRIEDTSIFFQFVIDANKSLQLTGNAEKIYSVFTPSTFLMITYRVRLQSHLIGMLGQIMQEYGGQVGCDDDWDYLYTLDTISAFNCYQS